MTDTKHNGIVYFKSTPKEIGSLPKPKVNTENVDLKRRTGVG